MLAVAISLALFGVSVAQTGQVITSRSPLVLRASDPAVCRAFTWAKAQALGYARDSDPVGPWYEAALPGRAAFCMRDVSHQAYGGQALGLAEHTYNMMHRFAENIAESRDWCTFWEIDRLNRPAPVDYTSDEDFWYTLPASFDVLDCCYRMFEWTGDRRYIDTPAMLNFYRHTMTDYIETWRLAPDRIMGRRIQIRKARGIPSYVETEGGFSVGVDLIASEAAACRAYARILDLRGDHAGARRYRADGTALASLLDRKWWDPSTNSFFAFLSTNGEMRPGDRWFTLYWDAISDDAKLRTVAGRLASIPLEQDANQVEDKSYYPEIDYRYGYVEEAYLQILDLAREGRHRREYPEVSYALIGAIARGLIGVVPKQIGDRRAVIETLPGLPRALHWAELDGLPVQGTVVNVRQESISRTTMANKGEKPVIWRPTFLGNHPTLYVSGKPRAATIRIDRIKRTISSIDLPLNPAESKSVSVFKSWSRP